MRRAQRVRVGTRLASVYPAHRMCAHTTRNGPKAGVPRVTESLLEVESDATRTHRDGGGGQRPIRLDCRNSHIDMRHQDAPRGS